MNNLLYAVIFYFLATVLTVSAALVVLSRNLVHSAVAMFVAMVCVAGLFILMDAEFLAAVQILIYAGAATVLILFVVMITAKRIERPTIWFNAQADISTLFMGIFFLGMLLVLLRANWKIVEKTAEKTTGPLAQVLFTEYTVPFEIASVILLVALVGAIVLARREDND